MEKTKKTGFINRITDNQWIIFTVICSLLSYYSFYDYREEVNDLESFVGWFFQFAGYSFILTIGLIMRIFKKFPIGGWLIAHWTITALTTLGNNSESILRYWYGF